MSGRGHPDLRVNSLGLIEAAGTRKNVNYFLMIISHGEVIVVNSIVRIFLRYTFPPRRWEQVKSTHEVGGFSTLDLG